MEPINPKFSVEQLYDHFPNRFETIENSTLYATIEAVSEIAVPEVNRSGDKQFSFYLPLQREGGVIAVPVDIVNVNINHKKIIMRMKNSAFHIYEGEQQSSEHLTSVLAEIHDFVPHLQQDPSLIEKLVPYDQRTGRIKGKYVLKDIMSAGEKERILTRYQNHVAKNLKVERVSLDDYLETAAIGYKAAFEEKSEGLSSLEMYRRWADGRHGGMLDIKDASSKQEFMEWYEGSDWEGSHPFEIVFSPINHGIMLIPPPTYYNPSFQYILSVHDKWFIKKQVQMVSALIDNNVAFEAPGLKRDLDHLCGESYLSVNYPGMGSFFYHDSEEEKQKYFPHITWDPLKIPKWKTE